MQAVPVLDQVADDCGVENQGRDSPEAAVFPDLEALDRDQRASGQDDQDPSPAFPSKDPEPFDQVEDRINNRTHLEPLELLSVDTCQPGNQRVDQRVLRIKPQPPDDRFKAHPHICVEEPEEAESERQGKPRLDQLVDSDQLESDGNLAELGFTSFSRTSATQRKTNV